MKRLALASDPDLALVSISPQAQTALTYVRGALCNPVSLSVMAFAVCVGVGYAGVLGALIATFAFVALGSTAARSRFIRCQLDKQFEYRVRQKREADRMRQLKPTGPVRQQQYAELRDLVNEIERQDSVEAERFELQPLLDHFIQLAVSHQRCLDSLRLAGSSDLPRSLPLPDPNRSHRRREIMQRRLRHRDECVRRIERLADELEAIDELVRLVAQRVACPTLENELDREIERRLWELDEVDAALHSLSATTTAA
ncbi:MAG TPA: hypothetical protein VL326_19770 [Kofleriaceae bacterium]|jgi:hypothetical protein|nr:hypothetical protein [Kofleriaceae bacterium]